LPALDFSSAPFNRHMDESASVIEDGVWVIAFGFYLTNMKIAGLAPLGFARNLDLPRGSLLPRSVFSGALAAAKLGW
jgi:hypothetical protein